MGNALLLLCGTKEDLLEILVPYFKTGLESNELCLWIISNSELITAEEAREALGQAVPNLDRFFAEGRIEIVPNDQWFLKGGSFDFLRVAKAFKDKLDEALAKGYSGMRVNGSPAWIENEDATVLREFEAEADRLFHEARIIASCTYPLEESRADFLLDVARSHQFVITRRNGVWNILETPQLMKAKQEIQRLNEELEQRVSERTRQLAVANEDLRIEIAERKQVEEALRISEDHLRLVIDTISMMAWSLQPDGKLDFVNQRWLDYIGLSLEEVISEPLRLMHPDDIAGAMEKWRNDMAAGRPSEDEMRLRRADGEFRWFLVRTEPLRDKQGNVAKWYGVSIDIEDRKQAAQAMRALSARVQSAREDEATRIAREIHDELGAALSSLRWDLEDIDEVISEAPEASQLAALRKKIAAMIGLTDTTVDTVRKITSELRPITLEEFGLVEAIRWHAQQFQTRTGIEVKYYAAPESVSLDREQSSAVFRIFQEALTNILRHAEASTVNVVTSEDDGDFVLKISDNGRGITEDEKSGALSLGLIGMAERAHLIDGEVDIEGVEGRGTVITVRVPLSG